MREVHILADGSVTHLVLKVLLREAEFTPVTVRERLALRFLYPLSPRYVAPASQLSLTDARAFADQLRFFVAEHARRHFLLLAERITRLLGPLTVVVHRATSMDAGSQEFIRTLTATGLPVTFVLRSDEAHASRHTSPPQDTDYDDHHLVAPALRRPGRLTYDERRNLRRAAEEHLNVGDAWTVIPLCSRLLEDHPEPPLYFLMGMALVMLGRTVEAETYYRRWRQAGTRERIRADYALAMLYVRHHPAHLRDLDRAEGYLEDGYQVLHETNDTDADFEKIFNRNGLALVEFRRGHIEQASALVRASIQSLHTNGPKESLYKAVLVYNIALCQQALGQWEQARQTFEKLLQLDPLMPDNHLNLSQVLFALHDTDGALEHIQTAIELDEAFPEAYSLRGYAHLQQSQLNEAIDAYRHAFHLNQTSPAFAYDLAYALTEANRHSEAAAILNTHIEHIAPTPPTADIYNLLAEVLTHTDGLHHARDLLRHARRLHPERDDIASNLTDLHNAITSTTNAQTATKSHPA